MERAEVSKKIVQVVVDAEIPREGQTFGPGGIRENGQMVTQYKNPRLYQDKESEQGLLMQIAEYLWEEHKYEICDYVFDNILAPAGKYVVGQMATRIKNRLFQSKIIDYKEVEVIETVEKDNIIHLSDYNKAVKEFRKYK